MLINFDNKKIDKKTKNFYNISQVLKTRDGSLQRAIISIV